jgi:hypothetical protein
MRCGNLPPQPQRKPQARFPLIRLEAVVVVREERTNHFPPKLISS